MSDRSAIQWTDATWNPTVGCSRTSPGCDHCYAVRDGRRLQHLDAYAGTIADGEWTGLVRFLPGRLDQPLRWRRSRRIFVDSMSDLFHPGVPDRVVAEVFAVMAGAPHHVFQVLTKRPQRMASVVARLVEPGLGASDPEALGALSGESDETMSLLDVACRRLAAGGVIPAGVSFRWPLPNVWLGTSIESDHYAFRADHLRSTPAAVRFLSLEPLIGSVGSVDLTGINWVIVGGESGPNARPMASSWVCDIRDRCAAGHVAFFFKQWGSWVPLVELGSDAVNSPDGGDRTVVVGRSPATMIRAGRRTGVVDPHRLEGEVHQDFPVALSPRGLPGERSSDTADPPGRDPGVDHGTRDRGTGPVGER